MFIVFFFRDLEKLFQKKDVIFIKYKIKDKNILKQKKTLIGDIKWPILVNLDS